MQKIATFFLCFMIYTEAHAAANQITICDLQRQGAFVGKIVEIAVRLGFTSHGVFIMSEHCKGKAEDVVVLFPKHIGTPTVAFNLDPQALAILRPYMRPSGGTAAACAVLTGQVFSKKDLRLRQEDGGPQGEGFGPRGAFSIALVLQSVREIHPCK